MLKWTLAGLLSVVGVAQAAPRHTGELLFKLKGSKTNWGIQKIRPAGKGDLALLKRQMEESGKYAWVSYNTVETTPAIPDGEVNGSVDVSNQWHHTKIQTLKSWGLLKDSQEVIVAVCDSGAMAEHEDLQGQLLPGRNFINSTDDNSTTTSHGTFVAGLIAALANDVGGVGVAPNVKVLPVRISDENGGASMDNILGCIKYATDRGAKVINVSFTGVDNEAVEDAGQYASDHGALLVYAAGNAGLYYGVFSYPDHEHVLIVGASNEGDKRWKWWKSKKEWGGSNYGPFIDIMAPGANLYSTTIYDPATNSDKYRTGSGTSFAAPIVSAAAALLFASNPRLSPERVSSYLTRSAQSMGSSYYYGAGRLNVYRAMKLAHQDKEFVSAR